MTLETCRSALESLLGDAQNRVIALSGKWGTGKSYLWNEVRAASKDPLVRNAVYASLFGQSSLADLKLRLAQDGLAKTELKSTLIASAQKKVSDLLSLVGLQAGDLGRYGGVALLAAPLFFKDKFLVLDDIERKHTSLSNETILGFVEDSVQSWGCRVLLILNSDQLSDGHGLWEQFREKVIDQELTLDTSPGEAAAIAERLTPSAYGGRVAAAAAVCQITNIRIIRKILRLVNRLLSAFPTLPAAILDRVIPSAVLLSAIHYKGINDGPTFDFVLKFDMYLAAMIAASRKDKGEPSPEIDQHARWRRLLDDLGISSADELEELIVSYLTSGLVDGTSVARIIERYVSEDRLLGARKLADRFAEKCVWFPQISKAELRDEAYALLPEVSLLDMYSVTSLHYGIDRYTGDKELAQAVLDRWLVAFRERQQDGVELGLDPNLDYFRHRPVHEDVAREVRAAMARMQPEPTLVEICRKVRVQNGWGDRESALMKAVTTADYVHAIRNSSGGDLSTLLLQSVEFLRNRSVWVPAFGDAPLRFLDACREILRSGGADDRYALLLRDVFQGAGIESELDANPADGNDDVAIARAGAAQ